MHSSLVLFLLGSLLCAVTCQVLDVEGMHAFTGQNPTTANSVENGDISTSSISKKDSNNDNVETSMTFEEDNVFLGIPGTTQTQNGYDTAMGTDSICWLGTAADHTDNSTTTSAVEELVKTVYPNPLVEDFLLEQTEILKHCPSNNSVHVQKPIEALQGERLRTLQYYNYTLYVEIDLDELEGDYIVTDDGTASIALQIVVCSLGKSGFCSPFVHEQGKCFLLCLSV